jgi:hypothetical protein
LTVLDATTPRYYLLHRSALGKFELSSDAVMASYTRRIAMAPIIAPFSEEEHAVFNTLGYTIGGMMVFPSNRVDGKITINGAPRISSTNRRSDGSDARVHPPPLPR